MASRVTALPVLGLVSGAVNRRPTAGELAGYLACQRLAERGVREVAALMCEGWTEQHAAGLLDTWLKDHGVKSFFHKSFVWFGDRTRFRGVRGYGGYMPSRRVLRPGEVFILDVAPILHGHIADVGYTTALGSNAELARAQAFLAELRAELPGLFAGGNAGADVWQAMRARIGAAGYEPIHEKYPFGVLGHRVHRVKAEEPRAHLYNFGWQSYWEFLSRGLFGQLLNDSFTGDLLGLWAIEPHVGAAEFGAKFEEILVVDEDGARWLESERPGA